MGFPGGASGKEATCWCRRLKICKFNPWVGKNPWRRAWRPTPPSSPGESQRQRKAWRTMVHRVTKGRTWLGDWITTTVLGIWIKSIDSKLRSLFQTLCEQRWEIGSFPPVRVSNYVLTLIKPATILWAALWRGPSSEEMSHLLPISCGELRTRNSIIH